MIIKIPVNNGPELKVKFLNTDSNPIKECYAIIQDQIMLSKSELPSEVCNKVHPHPGPVEIKNKINDLDLLTAKQKIEVTDMLINHSQVFSSKPGRAIGHSYKIVVKGEQYFTGKSYPVPFVYRKTVENQLHKLINDGIIERATSAYINPLLVVKKKNGTVRLYCRKFSHLFASKTIELQKLIRKHVKFKWTQAAEMSFQEIKQLFVDTVMKMDIRREFTIL
jgi:hypothetical protein